MAFRFIRGDVALIGAEYFATARFFEAVEVRIFHAPLRRFPALNLARLAGETGGRYLPL